MFLNPRKNALLIPNLNEMFLYSRIKVRFRDEVYNAMKSPKVHCTTGSACYKLIYTLNFKK